MWIGTRYEFHLYRFSNTNKTIEEIKDEAISTFSSISKSTRVSSIQSDRENNLWMTSMLGGGILHYNLQSGRWELFPDDGPNGDVLIKRGINAAYVNDPGQLWITSVLGGSLMKYKYDDATITYYGRDESILSDVIYDITPDEKGNLWLTTEYGVTAFNIRDQKVISSILFNQSYTAEYTLYDPLSRKLIIGLHDRFVFISTDRNTSSKPLPPPVLDRIWVNNEKYFFMPDPTRVSLPYTQKNISISFTAPYFDNIGKLKFAYQLKGADDDWISSDSRIAQYASLSPGNYSFYVKVGDEQGHWNEPVELMSFKIKPPVWKTPWFIALLFISISLGITWISRSRIKRIQREASLRHKMYETEMMALRAQMNPHFIFNSLNSIDALIHNNDKYQATMYLNKFAKLIRNILDSSKQNTISVAKDLENIRLYIDLEKMRSENSFTEEIHVDPVILQEDLRVPPLIMQPYVENAILHGLRNRADHLGQLKISIERKNGHLHYLIEDNGVGRKQAMNGRSKDKTSYGMQMSSDRIKLFNHEDQASVSITDLEMNGMPAGTRVEIRLNLK
jgi:two-component sensor histidine kinase